LSSLHYCARKSHDQSICNFLTRQLQIRDDHDKEKQAKKSLMHKFAVACHLIDDKDAPMTAEETAGE
jgi:hypothetical protein